VKKRRKYIQYKVDLSPLYRPLLLLLYASLAHALSTSILGFIILPFYVYLLLLAITCTNLLYKLFMQ